MHAIKRSLFVLLLLLPVAQVSGSDWKVAGGMRVEDEWQISFFDSESVEQDGDTVRVWVKDVPREALWHLFHNPDKKLTDGVARKLASGYVPPYVKLQSGQGKYASKEALRDDSIDLTADEVIVNTMDVRVVSKVLTEIDCKGKRVAPLSVIFYGKDGNVTGSWDAKVPDYSYIAPDSFGEMLLQLLCPTR